MEKIILQAFAASPLGQNLTDTEVHALAALCRPLPPANKGDLLHSPADAPCAGLLVRGRAQVNRVDEEGRALPLAALEQGDLWGLGEVLAAAPMAEVTALEPCFAVVFHPKSWTALPQQVQIKLWRNTATLLARKNGELRRRAAQLAAGTLREKIRLLRRTDESRRLTVTAMAEWLACDRSALSRELNRLKRLEEGE